MKTTALFKELNKLAAVARNGNLDAHEIGEIVREVEFTLREARREYVAAKAAKNRRKLTAKEKAARALTRERNKAEIARMAKTLDPFVAYHLTGIWNGEVHR